MSELKLTCACGKCKKLLEKVRIEFKEYLGYNMDYNDVDYIVDKITKEEFAQKRQEVKE